MVEFKDAKLKENIVFFQKENICVNDVSGENHETFYVNVIMRDKNFESYAEYAFWLGVELNNSISFE